MTASPLLTESGVSFRETGPRSWIVFIDADSRAITQDERGFIAWVGHQSRHWSFHGALNACVEDARYQAFRLANPAPLPARLSEAERWLLQFSDADNAADRMARARQEQVS